MSTTALQAGDLNYDGPIQLYEPKGILLATNTGAEKTYTTTILLPVPCAMTREKLTVMFVPTSGPLGDIHAVGNIWVAGAEKEKDGVAGGGGKIIPVTNLEGTQDAPTAFPKTDGLGGYSREFVTSANYIQAVITVPGISDLPGAWVLQTSVQPDKQYFPWEAWDQLRRLFIPQNLGGIGSL